MSDTIAWKIETETAWTLWQEDGAYLGSALDLADGFIHLSAPDQTRRTAELHFAGRDGLVLVAVDLDALGASVKWEASRGGAPFPHVHGPIPLSATRGAWPLPRDGEGRFVFPDIVP